MDKVSIKKEADDDLPDGKLYPESRRHENSRLSSFPPTQRVSPTATPLRSLAGIGFTPSLVDSTMSLSPPGPSELFGSQRTVFKLKRFLGTLIKFGTDISAQVGEKVREMVFNLVAGVVSVSEFHLQLQDVTNFPVRPYVLPFLHTNISFLQREIASLSGGSCKSVVEYLRQHENSILQPPPPDHGISEPSDIFHSEAVESHQDRKRRTSSTSDSESANKRTKPGGSLISPPLFQNGAFQRKDGLPHKWSQFPGKLAIVPGCPSSGSGEGSTTNSKPENQCNDDEWKNVQVMLNCILGMVEKTQRAISILQQRQTTAATLRSTEDIIEEVQASAVRAVNEVKQNALCEIARARHEAMLLRKPGKEKEGLLRVSTSQGDTAEICWNCGRSASETCSGCKVAKYCGAFCQHKDWENHHRVCRVQEEISSHNLELISSKPDNSKESK
ncbi:protein CBFA2T3 [Eurytemora carolleeae]|uniref:protein CBFA2T3 n=1 Tax=Eurytemora carolleeae TaxID=1294199 RepID=UPI000C761094|nr:protein CBFA2T3 [Eurytemora carolleeae]|eukprot:XP_023349495.1 protein CBFA2T3-like [Eurytemora affinis]